MKALSFTQPWGSLVALGQKRIETRSWSTKYRGPIAIHAAKGFPLECRTLCYEQPFAQALAVQGRFDAPSDLPRGAIVAVARLVEIYSTDHESCEGLLNNHGARPHERAFGDYSPGRYAWWLDDVFELPRAVPCRGHLQVWTVPPEPAARVLDQLPPRITREGAAWL